MKITVKANAKVNLLLDLTAVLANGYHSIYTVMQSVGLFDIVTVETTTNKQISLTCTDSTIPVTADNMAWKAADAFFEFTGHEFQGIKIHIEKRIPSQAGMAGGSADAAAVIQALNALFDTKLSDSVLCSIGEKIGADVPFCILGGTRLCLNKGEVMAPLPDLPMCHILIVKPNQGVSTKDAYTKFDESDAIRHPDNEGFLFAATRQDLKAMCFKAANVFEQVVEIQDRVYIKSVMRSNKAMLTMMTGSGSAIFGLFENMQDADKCAAALHDKFDNIYLTEPKNYGLLIE